MRTLSIRALASLLALLMLLSCSLMACDKGGTTTEDTTDATTEESTKTLRCTKVLCIQKLQWKKLKKF